MRLYSGLGQKAALAGKPRRYMKKKEIEKSNVFL
jgi:hypothetical protein